MYVLMDSWFAHTSLIAEILWRNLLVIGMMKADNKRHLVNGKRLSLKELYTAAPRVVDKNRNMLRLI